MSPTSSSRPPSQQDVADLAGVSRTTVSLVINEVSGVSISAPTRERILAAVQELGFRPNEIARGLRSSSTNVVGLITSQIATTPYAVGIISGAHDAAQAHGKMLLVLDTDGQVDGLHHAIAQMRKWRVEGLIYAADDHQKADLPGWPTDIPTALVHCYSEDDQAITSFVPDERQGGFLATKILIDAGHTRIGFINGPRDRPASIGRLQGYLDAHQEGGVPVDRQLIKSGDWWQESAARHTTKMLNLRNPPTALFCGNDWMAMGAYDIIKEHGLRIPDDIAVIGFDNREEIAAHMRPPLTSIALPYREMGRRAVDHILGGHSTPSGGQQVLHCPLVRRASI